MKRPDMETNGTELRISGVLGRLEAVLERENSLIGTDARFDITASNAQKSRCLYELNLLMKSMEPSDLPRAAGDRLIRLRSVVETNATRVKAHMEAVRDVTDLINEAVQAAEADGTYSMETFRPAAQ
jgi:hypothetical protein